MSITITNLSSVVAQRHLGISQRQLALSLERLSSGLRINRGADDPAGLIVSERLRAEIAAVNQAIDNSTRAINVIATTEGALNEINALLIDIKALILEAANSGAFSDAEVEANQLQIDSAIDSITRIANTTTFAGRKLLDGSLDYITSGVVTSEIADIDVLGAKFGRRDFIPVDMLVSLSALQGELVFPASATGGDAVTIDVQGADGIITLDFPASTTADDIITSINNQSDATAVRASAAGYIDGSSPPVASSVLIHTEGYGSNTFVRVEKIGGDGTFDLFSRVASTVPGPPDYSQPATLADGRDAIATINGASTTADGLKLSLNTSLLDMKVTLDAGYGADNPAFDSATKALRRSFAITRGGALFQLGPQVNTNQQESIGVGSMHANKLGNRLVGFLSELQSGQPNALSTENFQEASDIIDEVITQVTFLRGRLGAFERNTLQTNVNQLEITAENLTASESTIRDTNFAAETAELTRAQVLVQAGTSILAIANAQQQNILALLGR